MIDVSALVGAGQAAAPPGPRTANAPTEQSREGFSALLNRQTAGGTAPMDQALRVRLGRRLGWTETELETNSQQAQLQSLFAGFMAATQSKQPEEPAVDMEVNGVVFPAGSKAQDELRDLLAQALGMEDNDDFSIVWAEILPLQVNTQNPQDLQAVFEYAAQRINTLAGKPLEALPAFAAALGGDVRETAGLVLPNHANVSEIKQFAALLFLKLNVTEVRVTEATTEVPAATPEAPVDGEPPVQAETAAADPNITAVPQNTDTAPETVMPQKADITPETAVPQKADMAPEAVVPQKADITPEAAVPQKADIAPEAAVPQITVTSPESDTAPEAHVPQKAAAAPHLTAAQTAEPAAVPSEEGQKPAADTESAPRIAEAAAREAPKATATAPSVTDTEAEITQSVTYVQAKPAADTQNHAETEAPQAKTPAEPSSTDTSPPTETDLSAPAKTDSAPSAGQKNADASDTKDQGQKPASPAQGIPVPQAAQTPDAVPVPETPVTQAKAAQSAEIIDQIVSRVFNERGETVTKLEMQLHPASLGRIVLALERTREGVSVTLKSASDSVREMLAGHMADLQNALKDAGVNMKDIRIEQPNVGWDFARGAPQQNDNHSARRDGSGREGRREGRVVPRTAAIENHMAAFFYGASAATPQTADISLDLRA